MPVVVKMHNTTVSSSSRRRVFLSGVGLLRGACPYYPQGVHRTVSGQLVSSLDLACVALIFLPGPYFCVGGSWVFVFEGCVWGEAGRFSECLSRSHPSFGLSIHVSVYIFLFDQVYPSISSTLLLWFLSPFYNSVSEQVITQTYFF